MLNANCLNGFQILLKDFSSGNLAIRKRLDQKDADSQSFHSLSLSGSIIFTCPSKLD